MPIIMGIGAIGLVLVIIAGAFLVVSGNGSKASNKASAGASVVGPGISSGTSSFPGSSIATEKATPTATAKPGHTYAGTFTPTGQMAEARDSFTSTLLNDGRVLVAGGSTPSGTSWATAASAEIYNPKTGTFGATGDMTSPREGHTATLLADGRVLITGGLDGATHLTSAEIYDPKAGTFSKTGSMAASRVYHTATLLNDGRVLVAGGSTPSGTSWTTLASAEIYDPKTGTFSPTGSMTTARRLQTATLLPNGEVLMAGGGYKEGYLSSADLYDPTAGTFTSTGMLPFASQQATATMFSDGRVLIAGGEGPGGSTGQPLNSAALYDPTAGSFNTTGAMATARYGHVAALLADGRVLVAGGYSGTVASSAEIYDPKTNSFSPTGAMTVAREWFQATALQDGSVLLTGGWNGTKDFASAELY